MVVRPLLALAILGLIRADHGLIRYPCQSMDLAEVSVELAPRIATVGGAEYLAIYGAGQEKIGVGGMGGQVPNCPIRFHRYWESFPGLTPVTRAVECADTSKGALTIAYEDARL